MENNEIIKNYFNEEPENIKNILNNVKTLNNFIDLFPLILILSIFYKYWIQNISQVN
jgi:hypothetical protein